MTLTELILDNIAPELAALLGKSADRVWKAIDVRVPPAGGRGVLLNGTKKLRGVPAKTTLKYSCHFDEPRSVHTISLHLGMSAPMTNGVAPATFAAPVKEMLTALRAKLEAEYSPVAVDKTLYRVPRNLSTAVPDLLPFLKEQWRFRGGRFSHQAWGENTFTYEAHFSWSSRA
jgi:hypothetical protein